MLQVVDDSEIGSYSEVYPAKDELASSFSSCWSGTAGGAFRPDWWSTDLLIPMKSFGIFSAEDIVYAPSMGVIATMDGRVSSRARVQASYLDPDLKRFESVLQNAPRAPVFKQASLSIPWGALHNYGHFLLDGLSSVPFLEPKALTPALKKWQREHFATIGTSHEELTEPIYRIELASYTTAFGQNLHNPNIHFLDLRRKQLRDRQAGTLKIYVSRSDSAKRSFLCESRLIEILESHGFLIAHPETMSIEEQISLFHGASVIVAPTGAALANCLYCREGARVVEIIPREMTKSATNHKWVGYLAALSHCDWQPYFCENVEDDSNYVPSHGGVKRGEYTPFDADLSDLLSFIMRASV